VVGDGVGDTVGTSDESPTQRPPIGPTEQP
jgi:hypothetical protein